MKKYTLSVTTVGENRPTILELTTNDLARSMEQYQRNRPLLKWQIVNCEILQEDPAQLKINFGEDGI